MVTVDDLISLPYTSDLTQSGITYAGRSLSRSYEKEGLARFARLRQVVAEVAVELAFRRYLQAQEVPFANLNATSFSDPDRKPMAIAGRRCELVSYLVFDKRRIRELRAVPESLLEAPAQVPAGQVSGGALQYEDLYIFAILNALVTPDPGSLARAVAAEQPHHLLHPLPRRWAQPRSWASLGRLVMKGDLDNPLTVEVGGQNSQREFQSETLDLAPRIRTRLTGEFYSLSYLHSSEPPDGRIGIHSPGLGETYLVEAGEWGNIWVYGLEIVLVGYIRWGDFRRQAQRLAPGSQVFVDPHNRVEHMAVGISDLRPIADLVVRGKNWVRLRGGSLQ